MSFMQRQITKKLEWYEIETTCGTVFLPKEDVGYFEGTISIDEVEQNVYPRTIEKLSRYCEGKIWSVETRIGYGARLSAPGYMDCTEWAVFDTPEQAQAYLDEYYPEDETDETEAE
jgi:hypothetical protein